MKSQRVSVGDDELGVAVRSGSPTVLFLHGLAGHCGEWTQVIDHLGPEIGIINPDQRAHASSWVLGTRSVSRAAYLSDAVALVEQFSRDRVIVVGQSMGGIVATILAHARPELVSHVFLIEAGMEAVTEADLAALEFWFDSWPESFADREEAASFFGADERSTPAWVDGLARTSTGLTRRFDPSAMIATMRALASDNRWSEWENTDVPTTLVMASDSVIGDSEVARMTEARPVTEMIVIDDSGHDVHLDQPERVAALLSDHLRR